MRIASPTTAFLVQALSEPQPLTLAVSVIFRKVDVVESPPNIEIAVDGNRDGSIEFGDQSVDKTTSTEQFKFWLNEDHDVIKSGVEQDVKSGSPDYADGRIWSKRDLEDFNRLWIKTDQDLLSTDTVALSWVEVVEGAPAVKLWRAVKPGLEYLTDEAVAGQQINYINPVEVSGTEESVIPLDLFDNTDRTAAILFEGAGAGKGTLKVGIKRGGTIVSEAKVYLDLKGIKDMIQRAEAIWNGTDEPHNYSGTVPEPNVTLSPSAYTPPANEAQQAVVFVHGWNMSPEGSEIFAETMYKRLWHRGYKGRFAAFRWPTFYSSTFDEVPFVGDAVDAYLAKYNDSEYRAWKCGVVLKQFVESLPSNYTKNLVAHSMGNIVAGSALREGLTINNYALLQGAVPAICYDENANLRPAQMVRSYAGIDVTLWDNPTACDDADSGVRALTYRGQLSGVSGNLINFYLPRDRATANAWEFNNDKFKPQEFNLGTSGYYYDVTKPVAYRLGISFFFEVGRAVASAHEGMAYATISPTRAIGVEGNAAGAIDGSVNLSDPSFGGQNGFDTEHSAEFNRNIQQLQEFYQTLRDTLTAQ